MMHPRGQGRSARGRRQSRCPAAAIPERHGTLGAACDAWSGEARPGRSPFWCPSRRRRGLGRAMLLADSSQAQTCDMYASRVARSRPIDKHAHAVMQRAEVERIGKWAKDGRDRQRHLGGERARSKAQARHRLASLLQGWRRSASHLTRFRSPGVARGYMRPAKLCSQPRRPRLKLRHGQCGQGQAGSEPGRRPADRCVRRQCLGRASLDEGRNNRFTFLKKSSFCMHLGWFRTGPAWLPFSCESKVHSCGRASGSPRFATSPSLPI